MDCFQALTHMDARGLGAVNQALIFLLPKRPDAKELKDFRPVSLIHSLGKLIAKVLASRLAPKLPDLLGLHQSAFVKGRCLHDNFLMVQGAARRLHSTRHASILLKLDITKAFDSLNWGFLFEVLIKRDFGRKWMSWIGGLLGSATTMVLMNGIPGRLIFNKRGLGQGDPLSPMLFVVAMDVLNDLLVHASNSGVLSDCGLRNRTSVFADDVVMFLNPKQEDLQACSALLADFGEASGLHVNLAKCSAHPIRCSLDQLEVVASEMQCPVADFPCTYLGLPLGLRKVSATQL